VFAVPVDATLSPVAPGTAAAEDAAPLEAVVAEPASTSVTTRQPASSLSTIVTVRDVLGYLVSDWLALSQAFGVLSRSWQGQSGAVVPGE
jgi:hypothetical protein